MFRHILLFILVGSVYADTKVWNKNINFYNQQNWDKGRSPCPSDKILIEEQSTTIFLQTNGTLKELVLPMNGQIILASDLKISFSDDPHVDEDCPGQDIVFVRNTAKAWLNPNNWNNSELIPIESDQIPCEYDDVLFPSNSQFLVGLNGNILVNTLSIDGQFLTSSLQAANYLQSSLGRLQFDLSRSATLRVSGLGCGEATGCKCGNDKEEVLEKICSNVLYCPSMACQDAVQPKGSCCSICGGFLTLDYDTRNFNFEQTKTRLVHNYNLHHDGSRSNRVRRQATEILVSMYMSKTDVDRVQLVLTDNGQGTENGKRASQVAQQINDDMLRNLASFGLNSVTVAASGAGTNEHRSGGGTAAGIIIALVVAVIVVISIIFVMIRRQPFWLRKDELLDADIEMPQMNTNHVQELSSGFPVIEFDNPMYNKALQNLYEDTSISKEANGNVDEIGTVDDGFYNPMAITHN